MQTNSKTNNKPSDKQMSRATLFAVVAIVSLVFAMLGSVAGIFIARSIPIASVQQSKQVVIDEQTAVANVAKKVSPSVVSIISSSDELDPFTGSSSQSQVGAGTGIIMTPDGLILTNKHVVDSNLSYSVITSDGTKYKDARVVATDPSNDIAFIRVKADNLKPAELGDSDKVEVGQSVVAIGNALGEFQNTVTTGVISGKSRPITATKSDGRQEVLTNLFQTDAAINAGNSGGPLVDIEGRVIGINTAVAGSAENIGFAIPINDAKSSLETVKNGGKISRAFLGVRFININESLARANDLASSTGALVYASGNQLAVLPSSPAAKAGLKEGDIILSIDGQNLDTNNPLSSVIAKKKPGDEVTLVILRDGQKQNIKAVLSESENN